METLNFPMAKQIRAQVEEQMQQQQMMAQQQAEQQAMMQQQQAMVQEQPPEEENQDHIFDQLLAQLPKHEQDAFRKMDPEQQRVIMDQMMAEIEGEQPG